MSFVLGMDLGTTGNRVAAFAPDGRKTYSAYYEFPQIFPQPGWVEHDPNQILETAVRALRDVLKQIGPARVSALGITNQRETTVLWSRKTGKPVYNAIVWQCRRTAAECSRLRDHAAEIKAKTGLPLDPYFSATKIQWILDHVEGVREKALSGEILFGTIDTWILWNLTGGRVHATEPSNASRTLCFNLKTLDYDPQLMDLFHIPRGMMPELRESGGDFGIVDPKYSEGHSFPIRGVLGDQQASFFAQGGWQKGVVKNTYGTGLFLMAGTGSQIPESGPLINTVAWKMRGHVDYALEGSVFIGGAAIQWLRDGLGILRSAQDTEELAGALKDNEGVYFVPALAGLGAPYWDPEARGLIIGITRGTHAGHFARAALEAMAYQTRAVMDEMKKLMGSGKFQALRVDGGASRNNFLMQFQSEILGIPVERPEETETTVLGAAALAGMESDFWTQEQFLASRKIDRVFKPCGDSEKSESYYAAWLSAAEKSLGWAAAGSGINPQKKRED